MVKIGAIYWLLSNRDVNTLSTLHIERARPNLSAVRNRFVYGLESITQSVKLYSISSLCDKLPLIELND